MINDNYLNAAATLLSGVMTSVPSALAFGSTVVTLTTTDVYVPGEFDRNVLDSLNSTNNTVRYIGTRNSPEAHNEMIQQIALVASSTLMSSNNIYSNFLVSSLVHTTSFDISVEYWFTVNRG